MKEFRLPIKLFSMKSIPRLLALLLIFTFLAGAMTSCAVFDNSSVRRHKSFEHKQPLPKKWIIPDKSRKTIK